MIKRLIEKDFRPKITFDKMLFDFIKYFMQMFYVKAIFF